MGEHEAWTRSSGLLPNGLLPNVGSVIRALDSERWLKAEERTAELIACIQPNQASEERRNAVAHYVQRLVMKCFPCQVFTFGSVPLKTYLPDGDIDLTAFSNNQGLKDTWANQVRDMLESEEKNENAEFNVKEVQYIQAEVKLIKCLVENIVVDISFNQLGGLCTLCFLDEVDHLINQNHLFKCSIILIKAWCYYESRILGAHHGLISTYALETLVLYIFHVFNNSFAGPLEVLYRFLEYFSNFDWDNYCVSLPGPVPINSLPDMTAEPPRKDHGDLLLSKFFLDGCSSVYAVFPGGQENQGQPFVSKHFNVIDPLRINNNLGRSVSKGNFFRIRSAFAFGAKRLERLLDCPKENLVFEVNQFFMNTWERHGRGNRPDAPAIDSSHSTLSTPNHHPVYESPKHNSFGKKMNENQPGNETEGEAIHSHHATSQHRSYPLESMPWTSNASVIHTQNQKGYGNLNSLKASDQTVREGNSGQVPHADKAQRNLKSDNLLNDMKGRFLFVRTRSSPELTNTYNEVSSQGRWNRAPETGENQSTSARVSNNWKRSMGSEISGSRGGQPLIDDLSSIRHSPAQQSFGAFVPSNIGSNSYNHDSGSGAMSNEHSSTFGAQGMLQEEQDLVNIMASSMVHCFNGQVQVPLNLASTLPLPISSSVLASMGYNQRNLAGMSPLNIPLIDPFVQMQFPNGLLSPSLAQYFPGIGLTSNLEDSFEKGNENFGSVEMNPGEVDHDFWQEQNVVSTRGFDPDKHNFDTFQADEKPQSTSTGFKYVHSFQESSSSPSSMRGQQKYAKDRRGLMWEDCTENLDYQDSRGNEVNSEERMVSSRFSSASHSSSLRSKTSSESSWEGSSAKGSKAMRERRGTKTVSVEPSTGYGKGKSMIDHMPSMQTEEGAEWNAPLNIGTENADRSSVPQPITSMHVPRHHITGYEQAQPSGSDSMIPIAPVILGPGSKQRMMDNSGVFTFYPTGPPVPFLTMLPIYNIPPDIRTSNVAADEGVDNSDSGQNFEPSEGLDQSEELSSSNSLTGAIPIESSDKSKPDILNSDFASHWQNLQYGRFCQNPRYNGPMVYPSPVMVPPVYLQGSIPSDGHGRPPVNANVFTQLMSYGPRIVPFTAVQSVANRPPSSFQRFVDDIPRYRSGTGTYLPNPRISARERHSLGTRKGNYNYDRSDSHGDREGNWNMNSKSRATGRNHSRSQTDKSSSRLDRLSESRAERSWSSYRQESFPSYHSQNGSLRSSSIQSGHPNLAYSMYPIPAMNSNEASSNAPIAPSVMLYPFEHNTNYDSHAEQLEFGSIGPLGFTGSSEILQLGEGTRPRGAFEDQRHLGSSIRQSSRDQPSSPQHQRRI